MELGPPPLSSDSRPSFAAIPCTISMPRSLRQLPASTGPGFSGHENSIRNSHDRPQTTFRRVLDRRGFGRNAGGLSAEFRTGVVVGGLEGNAREADHNSLSSHRSCGRTIPARTSGTYVCTLWDVIRTTNQHFGVRSIADTGRLRPSSISVTPQNSWHYRHHLTHAIETDLYHDRDTGIRA